MTLVEQFEKEFSRYNLSYASVKYFLETGKATGSLHTFLTNAEKDLFNAGLMAERIIKDSEIEYLKDQYKNKAH